MLSYLTRFVDSRCALRKIVPIRAKKITFSQKTCLPYFSSMGTEKKTIEPTKWFPWNPTLDVLPEQAKACIVCIHGSGSDSTAYTGRGSTRTPLPNPLLEGCLRDKILLLSMHLPGRTSRISEPRLTRLEHVISYLIEQLKLLIFNRFPSNFPIFFVGHSLGGLIAYELVCACRSLMLPLPQHLFLSCICPPHLSLEERPWRPAHTLSSNELQQECIGWNINKIIFEEALWRMYEPILRDDFHLIDSYRFYDNDVLKHLQSNTSVNPNDYHAPLNIPTIILCTTEDKRITSQLCMSWKQRILNSETESDNALFELICIPGTHNLFYETTARKQWMEYIIQRCEKYIHHTKC